MDITMIIEAVIGLITAILVCYVIPTVKKALESKLTAEERNHLKNAVAIAVRAAEQIYKSVPKSGVSKKAYVVECLENMGYTVDVNEINALIEATVNELFPISGEGEEK